MRNVYLATLFVCVLLVSILGFRGAKFTSPPLTSVTLCPVGPWITALAPEDCAVLVMIVVPEYVRQRVVVHLAHIGSIQIILAGSGRIEAADQVHQRALA